MSTNSATPHPKALGEFYVVPETPFSSQEEKEDAFAAIFGIFMDPQYDFLPASELSAFSQNTDPQQVPEEEDEDAFGAIFGVFLDQQDQQ